MGVIAFAVLATWVYRHTQGNLLLPTLFHAANNTIAGLWFALFSGSDALRIWWLAPSLWVAAAVIVVLIYGPNLVRTPAQPKMMGKPLIRV